MAIRTAGHLVACSLAVLLMALPASTEALGNQGAQQRVAPTSTTPPKQGQASRKDEKTAGKQTTMDSADFDKLMRSMEALGGQIETMAKKVATVSAQLAEKYMSMTAQQLSDLADILSSYPRDMYQGDATDGLRPLPTESRVREADTLESTTVQRETHTTTSWNNGYSNTKTTIREIGPDTTIVHHLSQHETFTVNDSAEIQKIVIIRDGDTIRQETITPRLRGKKGKHPACPR